MLVLSLLTVSLLGGQQTLDEFRYADASSARSAWVVEGTSTVNVVSDGDRPVMRLAAPFATQPALRRAVADRRVQLDLTSAGGFSLELASDDPQSLGSLTLYFRSGDGWYAAGSPAGTKGWQTLRFTKSSFGVEGTPAGWDKIDGIRLSCWRPPGTAARDTAVRFRRLAATWQAVALILPEKNANHRESEFRASREAARPIAALLEELGLGADEIGEEAVERKSLEPRGMAILPNNSTMSSDCAERLARFVESGGKVIACYALPPRLGAVAGIRQSEMDRPATPGGVCRDAFRRR